MEDNEKPKRPNENYQLSKPDNPETGSLAATTSNEPLKFYYKRERRLENAPQSVIDLYSQKKPGSRFNLVGPLIGDKPRIIMFLTILILCIAILVLSIFNRFAGTHILDGNRLEISGIRYEGSTIIALRKTLVKNHRMPWTGPVEIAVSPLAQEGEDYLLFYHRVYFTLEPLEEFRFVVPFDSPDLLMVLQTERSSLRVRFKAR